MSERKLNKKLKFEYPRGSVFLFKFLLNILPLCLFFSYYPVITFGRSESMNFELSVSLLWLVVFDVVVLAMAFRRGEFWRGILKNWVWLLFPVWLSLTVMWSLNPVRGVLTVGILWLICFAVYGMWSLKSLLDEEFRWKWWRWFIGSTLFVCVWCVVQCVLDLTGVPRECTLLCPGCTYRSFGFPHPNGFSIEPQFMGNLLLAPTLIIFWILLEDGCNSTLRGRGSSLPSSRGSDPSYLGRNLRKPLRILLLAVLASSLFLTFSRGAIYAFVVGMVVMSVMVIVKEKKVRKNVAKRVGVAWLVVVGAFLFTLNLQGIMAQVSRTNDTYVTGVTKVLNHLSLGVIDVRDKSENVQTPELDVTGEDESKRGLELVENPVENFVENGQEEAIFDGYVAASTDIRVKLTGAALTVWRQDFKTAMVGVGLGGAGVSLYNSGLSPSPKEIIQNEYASLLLETGVVGVILAIILMVLVVKLIIKNRLGVMLVPLLVAYGVTLFFFSGLPNALQIYLMPAILMIVVVGGKVKVGLD